MNQEERLDLIETGRRAVVAAGVVRPFLEEQRAKIISHLVGAYRGGTLTHDMAIGSVGELKAMADLEIALESDQRQGNGAMSEELNG